MEYYKDEWGWRDLQWFYPEPQRIVEGNEPEEYYLNINDMSVHIDCYPVIGARARALLFHSIGGNGRLLSLFALSMQKAGIEVVCPDLPLFGHTVCPGECTYAHWEICALALAKHFGKDAMQLCLFGHGIGGMLAYRTATLLERPAAVIAMSFLDLRNREVFKALRRHERFLFVRPKSAPVYEYIDMDNFTSAPVFNNRLVRDKLSGGAEITRAFMDSLRKPDIPVEPEEFKKGPVLLALPENDFFVDGDYSRSFFDRLGCEKRIETIGGAGHLPIEPKAADRFRAFCFTLSGV